MDTLQVFFYKLCKLVQDTFLIEHLLEHLQVAASEFIWQRRS